VNVGVCIDMQDKSDVYEICYFVNCGNKQKNKENFDLTRIHYVQWPSYVCQA
jgi:hypothetical protein